MGQILLAIALGLYFLPAIWAYHVEKKNKEAILILNLFLGWTVIGWVGALIWAGMKD